MKRFFLLLMILSITIWIGCSDDGPTEPVVIPDIRIVVDTSVADPGIESANSAVWDNVDTVRLTVQKAGPLPKNKASKSTSDLSFI